MDYSIKLEVFKEIVSKLKEQQESLDKAYKSGVDLINFVDPLESAISMLIGSIYGKEGKETFDWWCWEKEWGERMDLKMTDKDGDELCRTVEELHQYLEENRTDDYELPRAMSEEERMQIFKQLYG
jgi:hypothetical protein